MALLADEDAVGVDAAQTDGVGLSAVGQVIIERLADVVDAVGQRGGRQASVLVNPGRHGAVGLADCGRARVATQKAPAFVAGRVGHGDGLDEAPAGALGHAGAVAHAEGAGVDAVAVANGVGEGTARGGKGVSVLFRVVHEAEPDRLCPHAQGTGRVGHAAARRGVGQGDFLVAVRIGAEADAPKVGRFIRGRMAKGGAPVVGEARPVPTGAGADDAVGLARFGTGRAATGHEARRTERGVDEVARKGIAAEDEARCVETEAPHEVGEKTETVGRPGGFGHGDEARQGLVFEQVVARHVGGPERALNAHSVRPTAGRCS